MARIRSMLSLLIVGGLATLSGCPGDEPATVYITNSRASFSRTVGLEQSWSWEPNRLGAVATSRLQRSTRIGLTSFTPRELYAFDTHYAFPTKPGDGLPTISYATQPGADRPLTLGGSKKPPTITRSVDFGVRLAQLVDHGRCTTTVPWAPLQRAILVGEDKPNQRGFLLETLRQLDASGWKMPSFTGESQAFFSVDPADGYPDTPAFNGLSFRVRYRIDTDCGIFGTCEVGVRARGDYAVRLENGLPKFETAAWAVDFDKDASTTAAEVAIKVVSAITPAGLLFPGFVSGSPDETLKLWMSTNLPALVTYAFKVGASPAVLNPNIFGITCNPFDGTGDAICAAQQPVPPAKATARDFFLAATARQIANRTGLPLAEAQAIALNIVPKLDSRGFWCDARPQKDIDRLGQDTPADQMGMCRWHPTYKRLNVLPDALEMVSTEFGELESTPDMEMIRWWITAPIPMLGIALDPRPVCTPRVFDALEAQGPTTLPRFVHTL